MQTRFWMAAGLVGVAVAAATVWLVRPKDEQAEASPGMAPLVAIELPPALSADAALGKRMFEAKCAACHGENAVGQDGVAPPLVHIIYEPSHHGDESFQRAVASGVRAHHWRFGDMPPVEGLTRADVAAITTYIRELQHANGID